MCIKHLLSNNINLLAQWAYFEPKNMGSIPLLYKTTSTLNYFSLHLEMQSHIDEQQNPKPVFKVQWEKEWSTLGPNNGG